MAGLVAETVLQFALVGHILDDDLITVYLASLASDFSSAKPHFYDRAVSAFPVNLHRLNRFSEPRPLGSVFGWKGRGR